eukprot:CAMPEP_0170451148 /NCGR_PEP_ID=MMETSP0123-20130129/482_1 /TAXON_ID=182087 /ORGANISM="Favella ehrenbergii, Strain Fehren 1" /LENGTH=48 /DNA_ID= /DNA_START= /DNA_END= /DNA_ORIENTATION=
MSSLGDPVRQGAALVTHAVVRELVQLGDFFEQEEQQAEQAKRSDDQLC